MKKHIFASQFHVKFELSFNYAISMQTKPQIEHFELAS